jgi:hypothetical protein
VTKFVGVFVRLLRRFIENTFLSVPTAAFISALYLLIVAIISLPLAV